MMHTTKSSTLTDLAANLVRFVGPNKTAEQVVAEHCAILSADQQAAIVLEMSTYGPDWIAERNA